MLASKNEMPMTDAVSNTKSVQPDNHPSPTPEKPAKKHSKILDYLDKFLRFAFPIAVSTLLVVWLFHKVNFKEMMKIIHEGFNFWWIAAMMLLTMLSRMIRGIRWGIQLRGAGVPRMTVLSESVSIWGAYALNYLFPWLGEAWRCIYVAKREKVSLSVVIGTDFGDRISDAAMIMLLIILAFFVARPALLRFIAHYSVGRDIMHWLKDPLLWCALATVIGLVWSILHYGARYRYISKVRKDLYSIWDGFKILFTMKGRGLYLVLTIAIWVAYFFENYLCFFAFPFTTELVHTHGLCLGLIPGLVVFVFGSCSMGVPSNGGLGPWNLAVMFALSLYGISDAQGAAFSMVVWTFQTAIQIALGIFSAGYVMITDRKLKGAIPKG